jgi:hypothetical protein
MQISFATAALKDCCLKREVAEVQYGRIYADRLVSEIADAEAFDNVQEWIDFLGGNAVINQNGSFNVPIGSRYLATFVSVDANTEHNEDGHIMWSSVEFIKLTAISDVL